LTGKPRAGSFRALWRKNGIFVPPADPPAPFVIATDPIRPPRGLEGAVYAIGNFDGVHLGHRAVIERTRRLAREMGAPGAIITFEPHPADFFSGRPVVFRLTPKAAKARALRELGLDGAVFLTFNAALAALSAEEFVRLMLVERLGARAVVVGWDFHFGKGRGGSPAFLEEAGRRYNFAVELVERVAGPAGADSQAISSTTIRKAIEAGDMRAAARLLGRDYAVIGEVIPGQKLGRTLGAPTANIALEATNRLAFGVYAVRVIVDGAAYGGVASFGARPTVAENGAPLLEAHLFDFDGDLYGKTLQVDFIERLRGEEKFSGLPELVAAMEGDKAEARRVLAERGNSR
jgi:riboflavin kinase / FMN adenylyltransferase